MDEDRKGIIMASWLAKGWCLVGRFCSLDCGCWVITHKGEAVILETPPMEDGLIDPAQETAAVLASIHARPKLLTYTHNHWDHTLGYKLFHKVFHNVPTLVHRSFSQGRWKGPYDEIWDGESKTISIGGEALILFPAPKHSLTDQILIFRGVAMMGDWAMGPHPDFDQSVPVREKLYSLARLKSFLLRNQYEIHTTLSVHGNELRRGVDFIAMLDEMHSYWSQFS